MAQALTFSSDAAGSRTPRNTPFLKLVAGKIVVCAKTWATRRRTRMALKQLEPWQLADVGLTRVQADTEAARVFWQV